MLGQLAGVRAKSLMAAESVIRMFCRRGGGCVESHSFKCGAFC